MATIQVQCVEHDLMIVNSPVLASGSIGVDFIQFSFCPKWDGCEKCVLFIKDGVTIPPVPVGDSGLCMIPPEAISGERLRFGVYGVKDGNVITSETLEYRVNPGCYETGIVPEPSPDIYDQMNQYLTEIEPEIEDIKSATARINEGLDGIVSTTSVEVYSWDVLRGTLTELRNDVNAIGRYRFYENNNIKKIVLPKCRSIESYAFYKCSKLEWVDLGHSDITSFTFGTQCFGSCPLGWNTLILRFGGVANIMNTSALSGTRFNYAVTSSLPAYIYVPGNLVTHYQNNEWWKNAVKSNVVFRAIEDYPDVCGVI